eukprot:7386561-Prymnesium_polylepis.3
MNTRSKRKTATLTMAGKDRMMVMIRLRDKEDHQLVYPRKWQFESCIHVGTCAAPWPPCS